MIYWIRKYSSGLILYLLFLSAGIVLFLAVPKIELHLILNSGHSPGLDKFFKILTWLGDGWFAVIFSLLFLGLRFRWFFMLIFSYAISGLVVQVLKRWVFPEVLRPSEFLLLMPGLQTVAGVQLHHFHGFPSGHAATAFAILLLTGFILKNRTALFLLVILAWLVAFSRIYLSQHFLPDVLAGSFLGTLSALFFYWYFQRMKPAWLDRSLLNCWTVDRT